jgi:uncharacterized protein YhaN
MDALRELHSGALAARDAARAHAAARARAADHAEGVRQERARDLPSVAEAEEAVAAATAELARVEQLLTTLALTRDFLEQAQEKVHRDIAPVLAASLESRLSKVTDDRYHEAMVDPATLEVRVRPRGGEWTPAAGLSVGTAEQVYLLLRIALAEHLGNPAEPCPLLLDDVTVQSDESRTRQILEALLALAAERQIVLFAQDEAVALWAKERIGDQGQHAIVELDPLPA